MLPAFGLFLVFHLDNSGLWAQSLQVQLYLFAFTLITTFVFPLMNVFLLLKLKLISSLEMETKEERRIPYLAAAIFYFAESYFLFNADVPAPVKAMMFGATLLVVLVFVINFFWKISAHMVGAGGLAGMMIALSSRMQINVLYMIMALILISGVVGWARLRISTHTQSQVYAGFLLGVFVEWQLFSPYPVPIPFLPGK